MVQPLWKTVWQFLKNLNMNWCSLWQDVLKILTRTSIKPNNFTPKHLPQRNKDFCSHKNCKLQKKKNKTNKQKTNIHSSSIHYSRKWETSIFFNKGLNKLINPYYVFLVSNGKDWSIKLLNSII